MSRLARAAVLLIAAFPLACVDDGVLAPVDSDPLAGLSGTELHHTYGSALRGDVVSP